MPPKSAASPASSASTFESSGSDSEEEVKPQISASPKLSVAAPKPDSSSGDSSGESDSGSSDDQAAPSSRSKPAAESESELGSESDDEPVAAATPKPAAPAAAPAPAPAAAASSSGEESGFGDESESDSDPAPAATAPARHSARVADPAVKPLASKPMPPKPAAAFEFPAFKPFQRIWSEEDEIALLTGIVDFKASTGIVPSTNSELEAFKDVIRKSVRVEVTTTRLLEKIRHLKRKYDTRVRNPNPYLAKPHDAAVYELSQKVWGVKRDLGENGDASGSRVKKKQKSGEGQKVWGVKRDLGENADASGSRVKKKQKSDEGRDKAEKEVAVAAVDEGGAAAAAEVAEVKVRYPYFTDAVLRMGDSVQSMFLVKEAIELVDDAKAMALERKYKKLKLQQMKSNVCELDLNKEAFMAVTDAMEMVV